MEFAKANPKKLNVSGDGPQSNVQMQHLVAAKLLGVKTNFVSYSGSGPALTALLGKKVDLAASTLSAAMPHIEEGRIRPLMVFSSKPVKDLSDVPTPQAAFGIDIPAIGTALRGIAAPKNTAPEHIAKLESAFAQVAKNPEFLAQAKSIGISVEFLGAADYEKLVSEYTALVETYGTIFDEQ